MKNETRHYPMLVPSSGERDDTIEETLSRWRTFEALSQGEKDVLTSQEMVAFVASIEKRRSLEVGDTIEISRLIRQAFLGEIDSRAFAQSLSTLLKISYENALVLLRHARELEVSKVLDPAYEQLTVRDAIEKFSAIKNQKVTSNKLTVPNVYYPLQPTVENWIKVYDEQAGVATRTSVERGKFLYHSTAVKNISNVERAHVSELLSSYDEESELSIDSKTERIVWSTDSIAQEDLKSLPEVQEPVKKIIQSTTRPAPLRAPKSMTHAPSHNADDNNQKTEIPAKEILESRTQPMSAVQGQITEGTVVLKEGEPNKPLQKLHASAKSIPANSSGTATPARISGTDSLRKNIIEKDLSASTKAPGQLVNSLRQRPQQQVDPIRKSPTAPQQLHYGTNDVPGRPSLSLQSLEATLAKNAGNRQYFKEQPQRSNVQTEGLPASVNDAKVAGGDLRFSSGQSFSTEQKERA